MHDGQKPEEAWRVARQFKALGEGLAQALRTAWESEEARQHADDLQAGLESLLKQIGQAVKEAAASAEGQRMREEARRTAESARAAGQQTWQSARPHLLNALRQLDAELQKLISRLEEEEQ